MFAPSIIEKVERNGAERRSLAKCVTLLRVTDRTQCFYCERPIDDGATPHVDHVIPWSFLLSDPLWDLVLACASCNLAKSDVLPDARYLDKLAAVAVDRGKRTLPIGFGSPLITRDELDRYYSAALSVEWPSGWMPWRDRLAGALANRRLVPHPAARRIVPVAGGLRDCRAATAQLSE
jgi:hypothetical protein